MICMVSQKEILMTLINLLKNKQKDVNVKNNKNTNKFTTVGIFYLFYMI